MRKTESEGKIMTHAAVVCFPSPLPGESSCDSNKSSGCSTRIRAPHITAALTQWTVHVNRTDGRTDGHGAIDARTDGEI